jgi:hypothetical protein
MDGLEFQWVKEEKLYKNIREKKNENIAASKTQWLSAKLVIIFLRSLHSS